MSDSEDALEHWKQRLHEVSTRRCAHITHTLRWIGAKVCDPPKYDGLKDVDIFVREFELQIPYQHRLLALYIELKTTPARWWDVNKHRIENWHQCRRLLQVRFRIKTKYIAHNYIGLSFHTDHITVIDISCKGG